MSSRVEGGMWGLFFGNLIFDRNLELSLSKNVAFLLLSRTYNHQLSADHVVLSRKCILLIDFYDF